MTGLTKQVAFAYHQDFSSINFMSYQFENRKFEPDSDSPCFCEMSNVTLGEGEGNFCCCKRTPCEKVYPWANCVIYKVYIFKFLEEILTSLNVLLD